MNQRWFSWNEFFSKKICSFSVSKDAQLVRFMCYISGLGEAQQVFLKSDLKNLIQKLRVGTNSPCLLRLQARKHPEQKITARFKLNLKTDGLICKMIFEFRKYVERLHCLRKPANAGSAYAHYRFSLLCDTNVRQHFYLPITQPASIERCNGDGGEQFARTSVQLKQCFVLSTHLHCSLGLGICIAHWLWTSQNQHHCSKQCRRIYICHFCSAKYLLGTPKPLNCIRGMQTTRLHRSWKIKAPSSITI